MSSKSIVVGSLSLPHPPSAAAIVAQVTVCYLARLTRGLWPSAA